MLLQRLRGADAHTEAIIVSNLVPLALVAPRLDFLDVIQSLSLISRSSNPEDPSRSSSAVLAAQTRLGRDLKRENRREPELCDAYLVELLQLFADRGTTVQMVAAGKREDRGGTQRSRLGTDGRSSTSGRQQGRETVTELTEQLSGLILPIDAVLQHETFDPSHKPSPELVALFRNMWFLIVVLGISRTLKPSSPVRAALDRIALKTPALVLESAPDYVESDLEYNSILKKDYADVVLSKQRGHLADVLPAMANEVRSFSLPQVTLLLTIWELEGTRTRLGKPSGMLLYFCNDSLNESVLVKPLDAIAGKVSFCPFIIISSLSDRDD
jgi:phosphatidylinositol 4-kinase